MIMSRLAARREKAGIYPVQERVERAASPTASENAQTPNGELEFSSARGGKLPPRTPTPHVAVPTKPPAWFRFSVG